MNLVIPLYILLIIFGIFFLTFATFLLMNLRDLILTKTFTTLSAAVTMIIIFSSISTLFIAFLFAKNIDWRHPLIVVGANWFNPTNSITF